MTEVCGYAIVLSSPTGGRIIVDVVVVVKSVLCGFYAFRLGGLP